MFKLVIIGFIFNLYQTALFSAYFIGDTMSVIDQNIDYDLCYGDYYKEIFKFSDINGSINGGDYTIAVIGISATW